MRFFLWFSERGREGLRDTLGHDLWRPKKKLSNQKKLRSGKSQQGGLHLEYLKHAPPRADGDIVDAFFTEECHHAAALLLSTTACRLEWQARPKRAVASSIYMYLL